MTEFFLVGKIAVKRSIVSMIDFIAETDSPGQN
jgi:hypothetical protein